MSETIVIEKMTLEEKAARDRKLEILDDLATSLRNLLGDSSADWSDEECRQALNHVWDQLSCIGLLPWRF